ncbi:hypothetical protein [Clostridium sp. Cult3]|uniref:hypothetical protein n=1 Tax=Clostridium sp. Cult3 TaxID=2079004 RepID=UPI001F444BFD|nr:hypothetical protein [Clostridium sp. Cult3]MCF6461506.1 hypothetical protein [Clostridium sp. Cult3]
MKQVGRRIIYNQDGEIVCELGEMMGTKVMPRPEITKLDYIDLEYGQIDYARYRIVGIDIETKQPILEEIEIPKTSEQQKIEELENQLLLLADEMEGGIL